MFWVEGVGSVVVVVVVVEVVAAATVVVVIVVEGQGLYHSTRETCFYL